MNWLKKAFRPRKKPQVIQPVRVARADHPISRKELPQSALRTLYGLRDGGFEAYIVGGGVRDLLAGRTPKDFDIATNAHPEQIRALFRGCRLVGRRFLIAHVRWGRDVLEVTTFRGPITDSHERDETGRILADNEYGSLQTDAFRRDFTINALYYDISDFSIVDYVGGMEDVRDRVVRLIGDPETRYREDPVRMLRAVRIANKLDFTLEPKTAAAIPRLASLLREIPPARLFDEVIKLLQSAEAVANLRGLQAHGLLAHLLPPAAEAFESPQQRRFIELALENTARRIDAEQSVTPAFLYAALLWPAVEAMAQRLVERNGHHLHDALAHAADHVLAHVQHHVTIPKRFSVPMREIWLLQPRFDALKRGRPKRLLTHPRFRAAYDFLLLRAAAGAVPQSLADWWTAAQTAEDLPPEPDDMGADDLPAPASSPAKRRRRRGGRRRSGGNGGNGSGGQTAGDA